MPVLLVALLIAVPLSGAPAPALVTCAATLPALAQPAGQSFSSGTAIQQFTASPGAEHLVIRLPIRAGEHLYGLGERFGPVDLVGQRLDNWVADSPAGAAGTTSYSPTPFLLSSRGSGLLIDSPTRMRFDVGATRPGCLIVTLDATEARVVRFAGPTQALVLRQHAGYVGLPPLPPAWGLGVWKNLLGGTASVQGGLGRLADARIPIDAVWIYDAVDPGTGFGWPWPIYPSVPTGPYEHLSDLIGWLHGQGLKVLGYLNPVVYEGSADWARAATAGWLVRDRAGQPIRVYEPQPGGYLDLTDPGARRWLHNRVVSYLTDTGFDGAMADYGDGAPAEGVYASGQPGWRVRNSYPVLYAEVLSEAAETARPGASVLMTRSGYTGSQHYATARWTGDQARTWNAADGLPAALAAMISGSLSGWPYWGPDIGGFYQRTPVPDQQELWIRWVELGALSPIMRDMLGVATDPIDLWSDPASTELFARYARLHESLLPYLVRLAEHAHATGEPLVRPVFLDHGGEPGAYSATEEYLLGTELLVAPVLRSGQRARSVWVPVGRWCDVWTGRHLSGPGWRTVAAPVDQIPLLLRDGMNALPGTRCRPK